VSSRPACRTSPGWLAFVSTLFLACAPASAQGPPRFELGGRIEWFGGSTLGDRPATLTPNSRSADPFVFFSTEGEQAAALGGGASLAVRLSNRVSVEGSVLVAMPGIEITIPNDVEPLPDIVAEGRLTEYLVEASVLADVLTRSNWHAFVTGGAGYLRQLHEGRAFVDEGRAYHAGGGVKYRLRSNPSGFAKGLGIRGQARLLVRDEGFSLEGRSRAAVNLGAGIFVEF
jgi:hypothetical protein